MALKFRDFTDFEPAWEDNEKERIKQVLREDRELLNEILTELRKEKIDKLKDKLK